MEGRKKMEEFYRKLKVGMKLKYAFTTVIVTFAVAMVVSLVSIVMMNVDTYKFYREAYAYSTLQMEIRKDIQLVGKYILWSMTTDDTASTQSYLNSAQQYADQGYQEVVDERLEAFQAGNSTRLPENQKAADAE